MTRLPESEFEIMKVVWDNEPPITNAIIMEKIGNGKAWKAQTALSLLGRLVEKGFLTTEKKGKERSYYPAVSREEYLSYETGVFLEQYHAGSLSSLVAALGGGGKLGESDIRELLDLLGKEGE